MFDDLVALSQRFLLIKNASYRRYFIRNTSLKSRLSLILGQRGVGKTTTLVQHLLDQSKKDRFDPRILYLQADHFAMGSGSLYEVAEKFQSMGGMWLAIDEVHKYANWSRELKSIYDTFPELHVVVSGSSALEVHNGTHDLARRGIAYYLQGLSFREYLDLALGLSLPTFSLQEILANHDKITDQILEVLAKSKAKILPHFAQYLKIGYYPYYFEINDASVYLITLEQNFHVTLESDLATIYPHLTGASISKIKKLLVFIAGAVPFTPNWESLKAKLDVGDMRTLKTYCKYLEDAGLIRSVASATSKLNLDKPAKIYLNNSNQMHAIATGIANIGTIRETFFLSMMSHAHDLSSPLAGDFLVDRKWLFEIGGKKKDFSQIKDEQNSFLACDDMERGVRNKLPLWLFGFIY